MVQQYEAPIRTYKYPFELVVEAYHLRYPKCDLIPILLDTEELNDEWFENESLRVTERRFTMKIEAPYILKKFFCHGRNTLNRVDRTLLIESRNETFSSRVEAFETCKYSVSPDNPNYTIFEQKACLEIKNFWGFESLAEKVIIKAYRGTFDKTEKLISEFIKILESRGITHVPIYKMPTPESPRPTTSVEKLSYLNPLISRSSSFKQSYRFYETVNFGSNDPLLEDDFFTKYLSQVSLAEKNKLALLHKKITVRDDRRDDIYNENCNLNLIMRFLKAHSDMERAYEYLIKHLNWRRQINIDNIMDWQIPQEFKKYVSCTWHYVDLDDSPLFILKLGTMDIRGIIKTMGPNGITQFLIKLCEEGRTLCDEQTVKHGKLILSWTLLVDLHELSLKHAWKPVLQILIKLIEVLEVNYPESLSRVILTRPPKFFALIWSLICAFICDETKNKFITIPDHSDQAYDESLKMYIKSEYIPRFLGGQCECNIEEDHHMIPTSLYVYNESLLSDFFDPIIVENLYKKAEFHKKHNVEVPIDISKDDGVITWDFDVLEGCVSFCVYFEPKSSSLIDVVLANVPLEKVNNIEPHLYYEGSSVQGSHYCRASGTYILQWKHETVDPEYKKSVVLYYHDVLPQNHLKRSMMSIRSSLSNTSSIETVLTSENLNAHSCSAAPISDPSDN